MTMSKLVIFAKLTSKSLVKLNAGLPQIVFINFYHLMIQKMLILCLFIRNLSNGA